jgi:hypothetical protein
MARRAKYNWQKPQSLGKNAVADILCNGVIFLHHSEAFATRGIRSESEVQSAIEQTAQIRREKDISRPLL